MVPIFDIYFKLLLYINIKNKINFTKIKYSLRETKIVSLKIIYIYNQLENTKNRELSLTLTLKHDITLKLGCTIQFK